MSFNSEEKLRDLTDYLGMLRQLFIKDRKDAGDPASTQEINNFMGQFSGYKDVGALNGAIMVERDLSTASKTKLNNMMATLVSTEKDDLNLDPTSTQVPTGTHDAYIRSTSSSSYNIQRDGQTVSLVLDGDVKASITLNANGSISRSLDTDYTFNLSPDKTRVTFLYKGNVLKSADLPAAVSEEPPHEENNSLAIALAATNGAVANGSSVQDVRDQYFNILSLGGFSGDDRLALKNFDTMLYASGVSFDSSKQPPAVSTDEDHSPIGPTEPSGPGTIIPPSAGPLVTSGTATEGSHMFTLIKSDSAPDVYVLNNRGERFHVSETLMHEMQAGGSWYEPEVRSQADVNAMNLRFTVDSVSDLNGINNATFDAGNHTYMLIKGNGAPNPDNNVLTDNGNAIFAIDETGRKVHVTGEAFAQLGAVPIANVTQNAANVGPVTGGLVAPGGTLTTTTDASLDPALVSAMPANLLTQPVDPVLNAAVNATTNVLSGDGVINGPATASAPAVPVPAAPVVAPEPAPAPPPAVRIPEDEALAVVNSGESTGAFNFQRDSSDGAIYAVNSHNQKFHITPELWGQLTPSQQTFQDIDHATAVNMQNGSNVGLTNLDQLRSINIGAGSEFRLVKGDGAHLGDTQLEGNGAAVYALTSDGDRYHVTAELAQKMGGAFNNIETLSQGEVDHLGTFRGSISTVADFNRVVKDQSGASGGFDGDTSSMPGGIPPVQGYADPH